MTRIPPMGTGPSRHSNPSFCFCASCTKSNSLTRLLGRPCCCCCRRRRRRRRGRIRGKKYRGNHVSLPRKTKMGAWLRLRGGLEWRRKRECMYAVRGRERENRYVYLCRDSMVICMPKERVGIYMPRVCMGICMP